VFNIFVNCSCTNRQKKGYFSGKKKFASKYVLLFLKFVTLLMRPLVIRGNNEDLEAFAE
jgi:hypothetical protein